VVVHNINPPDGDIRERYAKEHKAPMSLGALPSHIELVEGRFWLGTIARHDRRRLRSALWAVLAKRLLSLADRRSVVRARLSFSRGGGAVLQSSGRGCPSVVGAGLQPRPTSRNSASQSTLRRPCRRGWLSP